MQHLSLLGLGEPRLLFPDPAVRLRKDSASPQASAAYNKKQGGGEWPKVLENCPCCHENMWDETQREMGGKEGTSTKPAAMGSLAHLQTPSDVQSTGKLSPSTPSHPRRRDSPLTTAGTARPCAAPPGFRHPPPEGTHEPLLTQPEPAQSRAGHPALEPGTSPRQPPPSGNLFPFTSCGVLVPAWHQEPGNPSYLS